MTSHETVLSAVVRGDETRWPYADDPQAALGFLEAVAWHGLQPIVARQVRRGVLLNAPSSVREPLARGAVQHAAVAQRLAEEARRVLDALAHAGVPALLMKGGALAYTHYPHPCLRPRTDTDLVLRDADVAPAARVFEALEYEPINMTQGDLLLHQRSYGKTDGLGIRHVFDVHWRVAAPVSVSGLLSWHEIDEAAAPVEALGEHARALGGAHALLLSCVHRMAHHYDNRRLIWLYDIHLLASRLREESLRATMRLALEKGVAAMCIHGLELARERFGTHVPADLEAFRDDTPDAPLRFDHDVRMVDILGADLKALPGWQRRLALLRQHVFPPAAYMQRRYGICNPIALPVLYVHRFCAGAVKWLRPAASTDPFA